MRSRPLAAKQIYSQDIALSGRAFINRRIRDSHRAVPDVRRLIDARRNFESRVPCPTMLVVWLVEIYVEINPFALRRDFKLLITLDVINIRANEYFGHVPIPELVGFVLRIRIWLQREFLIRADKQEIEILVRPAGAHFRAIPGNALAVRILLHEHRPCPAPEFGGWVRIESGVFCCPCALHSVVGSDRQTRAHERETYQFKKAIHPNAPARTRHPENADMTGRRDRFPHSGREKDPHANRDTTGL